MCFIATVESTQKPTRLLDVVTVPARGFAIPALTEQDLREKLAIDENQRFTVSHLCSPAQILGRNPTAAERHFIQMGSFDKKSLGGRSSADIVVVYGNGSVYDNLACQILKKKIADKIPRCRIVVLSPVPYRVMSTETASV